MNPYIDNEWYWCKIVEVEDKVVHNDWTAHWERIWTKVVRYKVNTTTGLFEEVTN